MVVPPVAQGDFWLPGSAEEPKVGLLPRLEADPNAGVPKEDPADCVADDEGAPHTLAF